MAREQVLVRRTRDETKLEAANASADVDVVVVELTCGGCSHTLRQTDRQTHRHTDRQTGLPWPW